MTHDELLAKINYEIEDQHSWGFNKHLYSWLALRDIVEHHKEVKLITGQSSDRTFELSQQVCEACTKLTGMPIAYPCKNIQVIVKRLK